ncbi:MAG: polyprenol phosphomannose-dependent alpha 1,6 mannosyltransferase MptB, partial [Chloroflexota bacterium]
YDVPLLDLGKIANYEPSSAAVLLGGYALIFALYFVGHRAVCHLTRRETRDARRALAFIIASALLFALILLSVYPIGANDIYDYIFRARLWGYYDFNPLTVTPLQVNDDRWFPFVVWIWFPSPYGPLWTYLSVALYRLAGDVLLTNLVLFKLLPALSIVACAFILYDMLKARGDGRAVAGVLLFTWNPLLLFESVVNGHNDIVMVMFVLVALWLYRRRRFTTALVCCVLAACVKAAAAVALPLMFVAVLRQISPPLPKQFYHFGRGGRGVRSVLACLAVVVALYAPLWRGAETLAGLGALDNRFTSSLAAIVKLSLEAIIGREPAEAWTRSAFGVLFVLLYGYRVWQVRSDADGLQEDMFTVFALLLIVGTLWFEPWYVVWVIALAPLVKPPLQRMTMLWSASALCTYLIFDFAWYWWPDFFNTANVLVLNVTVVALWLGPLLVRPARLLITD